MHIALISDSDATVWVASITALASLLAALFAAHNSRAAKRELRPNHGTSALDRMVRRFDALEAVLAEHSAILDRLISDRAHDRVDRQERQAELDARLDRIDGKANDHRKDT